MPNNSQQLPSPPRVHLPLAQLPGAQGDFVQILVHGLGRPRWSGSEPELGSGCSLPSGCSLGSGSEPELGSGSGSGLFAGVGSGPGVGVRSWDGHERDAVGCGGGGLRRTGGGGGGDGMGREREEGFGGRELMNGNVEYIGNRDLKL
ncbi:uncharacterized protein A4U43_C08F29550 [Asparagus officinalis]|nr:uncharacterized protein A4U43_C08F29550 [Asparagus officinalis]